ncbi:M14 family zinc carboxypeptidase, partial [Actinomadura adrarensis]
MPSGRSAYRTLDDYNNDMDLLVQRHPNLVKKVTLPHRTTQGRTVYGIEVTKDAQASDGKPVLLITGMVHGNEWASGEVAIEYAFDLTKNYGQDKKITRLLDRTRVMVVPIVNVDGFVANSRRTATNTDMNRNFGFGWSPDEPFPGAGPWSEPETENVRDVISSRQVTTFLTMHTCLANMLYPPLQLEAGLPQDIDAFRAFADAMGEQNGYYHVTSAEDYETAGEAIDWSYYATRGLGVTVEVCTNPPTGLPRTYQTLVPEQYWGIGAVA